MAKTAIAKNSKIKVGTGNRRIDRRTRAARHLELETLPFAGTLSAVFRNIKGGFRSVMEYVPALAERDTRFARLWYFWDKATKTDQDSAEPEDFLTAAGLTPTEFVKEITGVMFQLNADAGVMIAAINHPKVVAKTVQAAMSLKYGVRDRENLLKAAGTLPLPKSAHLHIHGRDSPVAINAAQIEDEDRVGGLPRFEQDTVSSMEAIISGGPIVDTSTGKARVKDDGE